MGATRKALIGSCLLAALAGCARMWFAEREPWRREAEIACLQSGAVKEGPGVAIITAMDGPGVCGLDFPLRVSALGEPAVAGFADEPVRPPGLIPGISVAPSPYSIAPEGAPYAPVASPPPAYPAPSYPAGPGEP